MTQAAWYNEDRVRQPGSVVLARALPELAAANAARRAGRGPAAQTRAGGGGLTEFNEWVASLDARSAGAVTESNALSISAVYACVNVVAGAIAQLPLHFYRRTPDGRERTQRDEWWLFNEQFAAAWSAPSAWAYLVASKLLHGDAIARLVRASPLSSRIIGVQPLNVLSEVSPFANGGRLGYQLWTIDERGRRTAGEVLDQDDVLHVPGPGFDGVRGMSQIRSVLRGAGGIALGGDHYINAFFRNGARPDFALTTEGNLNTEQIATLRNQWDDIYGGASRAWKPAVLAGGLKVQPISLTSVDAQILETRRFAVEDICRIFGVPAFMVGHTDKTTSWGTGIEQMSIGFTKYTLGPHLVAFEAEINRKLFRTAANFCEFVTAGLERGDLKSRNESYRVALGRAGEPGWMTVNEVRALENLPPIEGGDELAGAADPAAEAADAAAADAAREAAADAADLEARRVAALERQAAAAEVAATVAPVINVAAPVVNVAPPDVLVEAPVVNVAGPEVHNHLPEPVINFEATLPEPVINVAAPDVQVHNQVQVDERAKVQDITRGADGEIVRVVTRPVKD